MKGGNGGWGNVHYKTSVNQAPRFAQKGIPGKTVRLKVELQLMADIGFVGFPNAGKSSLLDAYTNARPKIAPYPFTTKIPNLGMLKAWDRDIVLADIPGIIEGAHDGKGLGIRFIKHISRTAALAFLVDLSDETFLDAFPVLLGELRAFSPELARKPKVVVGTKLDCEGASENLAALVASLPEERVFGISVFSGAGLDDLKKVFFDFVESAAENRGDSEPEDPFFTLADSGEAESERDDHDTRDGEDS
jgi:GTP-binding protein